ncbi:MAG: hypothetical protein COZ06_22600 [Armatimonadetes bacterium CG_4_10_14_3_um_filter_66_18]|nr:hypothetical protein [Armatimonadota bacterium]OIP02750.1 MAG: hypothetical protein AUJ96_15885 [Armatimonadetes bacterium CG2_30_66_41]PIU90657.1 MAG: hypothetical protein COS65_24465 [Armatimonadetes bacterium CG06_land_8_20_14_3_00_66_21]PIX42327.1 MAG: hypothetical protein COZ57_21435 [Armatimonadetes bacterium CG_4_8_14_3_um_filter_66_20]PIY43585.1 MAG: hypothetical protein COZ06_22600 [Armatimonadetes bacterium CG_4_10_14_3_um_filter_66_18]PIZ36233.1 MAG: hypothetical protein COY42_25
MLTRLAPAWLMALLLVLPLAAAPATYPCYQPTAAPVIDGNVESDPAWTNIPRVTGFAKLGGGYAVAKQTVVQACWDDQALYVAMVCEDPDAAQLKPTVRDGGPFWEEDGAEIFVQPDADKPVSQLGVTAGGAKGGFEGFPDFTKLHVGASIGKDAYSLEARIPFDVLRATPQVGDRWRGNFCRNTYTTASGGDKFTCWAPLKTRFLEPENYAVLSFRGPAPEAATATRIGEQLNGAYRKHLLGRLVSAVAQGKEYFGALDEASRDQQFGADAAALRARWREMEALIRQAGSAPLPELRRTIVGADALAKASYDVKYAYLIAKLFPDQ